MISLTKKMLAPSKATGTLYGYTTTNLHIADRGASIDSFLTNADPLFEHIKDNELHQPYFDIDHLYDYEGEDDFKHGAVLVLEEAVDALLQVYPDIDRKDLYASSYSGEEKSRERGNKPTKKYGKHIVSFHIVVGGYQCTNEVNKAIATHLKTVCGTYDTQVYSNNQLFRVAGHHKHTNRDAGCRSPKLLFHDGGKWCEATSAMQTIHGLPKLEVKYRHLVKYLPEEAKPMVLPSGLVVVAPAEPSKANAQEPPTADPPAPTTTDTTEMNEELFGLLCLLPQEDRDDCKKWWYVTTLVKSIAEGDPACNKRSWDAWSRPSPSYDASKNEATWSKAEAVPNALAKLKSRISKQGITPEIRKVHEAVMDSSDEVMVGLLVGLYGKFFKVVDYAKSVIYMYDHTTSLWKPINRDYLHSFLSVHFAPLRAEYQSQLGADPTKFVGEQADDEELKKLVGKINKNLHLTKFAKTKTAWTKEFFTHPSIQDVNFERKLNQCKDYISVENGLVDLRDGTLIKREFHHCISTCLDITYDASVPPASNTAFTSFINEIFDAEGLDTKEIATYLQVWLGYCISGHNDAQVCLILFGCGSNGKSLLQDILLTVLKTSNGKMIDTWSSKVFDEAGTKKESANQATPELAKLEGCRIGLVNETAEGQTFGEGFKKLVDNTQSLPVRQLHQASKFIQLVTKFMMNTNHFPQIPTDPAYVRRVHVLPMLMRFVDAPNGKDQKLKDIRLRDKMLCSPEAKQAIFNWMVEGAVQFFARDKELMPLPASCQKYKDAYINQNEWMTQFVITEDKKDCLTYEEIKETLKGFTDRNVTKRELKEKLIEAGAKEGKVPSVQFGGRKMGLRFVKLAHALYEAEEEDEVAYGFTDTADSTA